MSQDPRLQRLDLTNPADPTLGLATRTADLERLVRQSDRRGTNWQANTGGSAANQGVIRFRDGQTFGNFPITPAAGASGYSPGTISHGFTVKPSWLQAWLSCLDDVGGFQPALTFLQGFTATVFTPSFLTVGVGTFSGHTYTVFWVAHA